MSVGVWLLWVLGAFLSGSIPFAVLLGRIKGVDIRKVGSGNPGATNLGRAVGKKWGFACFVLDVLKGLVPALLYALIPDPSLRSGSAWMDSAMWVGVGIAAVLGHMFSPWLGFKGGKGVATGLGATLGLWPVVTLPGVVCGLVWVVVAKVTGYVGLSSVVAAALLPVLTVVYAIVGFDMTTGQVAVFGGLTSLLALLVIVRHRGNLARLRAGTEPKAKWTAR